MLCFKNYQGNARRATEVAKTNAQNEDKYNTTAGAGMHLLGRINPLSPNTRWRNQLHRELEARQLSLNLVVIDGLVFIVLAIGSKVHGFKSGQGQ
jgi:hypothetical protein